MDNECFTTQRFSFGLATGTTPAAAAGAESEDGCKLWTDTVDVPDVSPGRNWGIITAGGGCTGTGFGGVHGTADADNDFFFTGADFGAAPSTTWDNALCLYILDDNSSQFGYKLLGTKKLYLPRLCSNHRVWVKSVLHMLLCKISPCAVASSTTIKLTWYTSTTSGSIANTNDLFVGSRHPGNACRNSAA